MREKEKLRDIKKIERTRVRDTKNKRRNKSKRKT